MQFNTGFPSCKSTADQPNDDSCVCHRPVKTILCRSCGYVFGGRMRISCPVHPNIIHLMDINCCPSCRAGHLKEFKGAAPGKMYKSN